MAQWVGWASSHKPKGHWMILSQGTCLGWGPGPHLGGFNSIQWLVTTKKSCTSALAALLSPVAAAWTRSVSFCNLCVCVFPYALQLQTIHFILVDLTLTIVPLMSSPFLSLLIYLHIVWWEFCLFFFPRKSKAIVDALLSRVLESLCTIPDRSDFQPFHLMAHVN